MAMMAEAKRRKRDEAPAIHPELAGSVPTETATTCGHCGLLLWRDIEEPEPDKCSRCGKAPGGGVA